MTTVFLDAVFKPFLKSSMTRANNWDRSDEFPDGWLPSNHSTYGVCECKHAISNTPKGKKSHVERSGEGGGPRHVSETGNELPGKHVSNNGHWLVCSALWHHLVETTRWHSLHCYWSGQPRGKECWPPRPPPRPTYRVLPVQKMSGSRGSHCILCMTVKFPVQKPGSFIIIMQISSTNIRGSFGE